MKIIPLLLMMEVLVSRCDCTHVRRVSKEHQQHPKVKYTLYIELELTLDNKRLVINSETPNHVQNHHDAGHRISS